MSRKPSSPAIPLPRAWPSCVQSAILHVIALAQYSLVYARSWAANSINPRLRETADSDHAYQEIALLREQIRILNVRIESVPAHRRPHYPPTERMAILELKAAHGWSLVQTANAFMVADSTVAAWMKRLDEEGPNALVQLRQPVNRFPDLVRYIVQRLKVLCPTLGKVKIAEMLARAGLHLGVSTVGRILKEESLPEQTQDYPLPAEKKRVVTAKYPNYVWHTDLTVVPTLSGFWTAWIPFSLPQYWPFCFWVAIVEDHFTRKIMGTTTFFKQPTAIEVRGFLGRAIHKSGAKPRHLISDKGAQFWNQGYKDWCKRRDIKPRFGAIGQHGNIAVVERLILTVKTLLACLLLVSFRRKQFQKELSLVTAWYNEHRPHMSLNGKTPDEVYHGVPPKNRSPRFEPRAAWPRGSPCAAPQTLVKGKPGVRIELDVSFLEERNHLPIIKLLRVA